MGKANKNFYIIIFIAVIGLLMILIPLLILIFYHFEDKDQKENQTKKNLLLLFIDRYPNKLKYKEGEIFDDTGLILRGFYDDNSNPQIFDYKIDNTSPLSIYNDYITFSYEDKNCVIGIEIINDEDIKIIVNLSEEKYTLEPSKDIITRFEIEDADVSKWIISNNDLNNTNKIISRNDASREMLLSGLEKGVLKDSELNFIIDLYFDAEIELRVSYSQREEFKNYEYDMSLIYSFILNDNKTIEIYEDNKILYPRNVTTKWQLIKYKPFILPQGKHNITLKVLSGNEGKGTPNIDYIDFKTLEKYERPEENIPYNDFHTFEQYLYINDSDPTNIYKYADGVFDLSKPKGNILDFYDSIKAFAKSYIIEISDNINFENSIKVFDLKEKNYNIKNLKLEQKIYYRGAITEQDLLQAKIYEYTVNNKGPRNLDVPGISNIRDIGGYETTLVENGKITQGLFYRSAQINDITEEGKKIITKDLGIKVEIDLREKYLNTGPYIDDVKYYPISIDQNTEYKGIEQLEEQFYKVFTLISQADTNPILLHCMGGADRTGVMSFALLVLLGCNYNDIIRDYLFTNFSNNGVREVSEINDWWDKLSYYGGETKAEQCKSLLMNKGLEEAKLEHIRAIFIEGYQEN